MRRQVKKYPSFPPGKSPLYFWVLLFFFFVFFFSVHQRRRCVHRATKLNVIFRLLTTAF